MWTTDQNLGSEPQIVLTDNIGRWTKIIILRWTNGPIFTMNCPPHAMRLMVDVTWTDSDNGPWLFVIDEQRWTKTDRPRHGWIQTTDHQKYKNVDGVGRGNRWMKVRP